MQSFQQRFIQLAIARQALKFGEFTLKSGRVSPYFFNAGQFNDGASLAELGQCYAAALAATDLDYDMLFGPAYKGIPLVAVTAAALAERHQLNKPWSFNRKEAKDHGEAGLIVGSPLAGRVLIVDDVITAGTAVRESVELIRHNGATPVAILVAVDRQERGVGAQSAVQEVEQQLGLRCVSILTLSTLISELEQAPARFGIIPAQLAALHHYRTQYGISR